MTPSQTGSRPSATSPRTEQQPSRSRPRASRQRQVAIGQTDWHRDTFSHWDPGPAKSTVAADLSVTTGSERLRARRGGRPSRPARHLIAFRCSRERSGVRTRASPGCKPPVRVLLVGQTSCLWSAGDTAYLPRATVLLRTPDPAPRRPQERRGSPLAARRRSTKHGGALADDPPRRAQQTISPESRRDRFRPHPGVRGPGALRLLRLSRPLRSRYAFATVPVVRARYSFSAEQSQEGSATTSGRSSRPPPLLQPWRSASRLRPSPASRAIVSCRPVLASRQARSYRLRLTRIPRNPRRLAPRARCTPRDERGSRHPVRHAALSAPRSLPDRHLRAEDGRVGAENRAYVPMRQCRSGRSGYFGRPVCWRTGGLARLRPDQSRLSLTVAIRASRRREADRCKSPRTTKLSERGVAPGGRTLTSRPFWGGLDG